GGTVTFNGDGWSGTISKGHFNCHKGDEAFDLQHVTRTPPSLGAKPPAGAIVLFDGTNMDSWAKMMEREWLKEEGPSKWHLIPGGQWKWCPARAISSVIIGLATLKSMWNFGIWAGLPTVVCTSRTVMKRTSAR